MAVGSIDNKIKGRNARNKYRYKKRLNKQAVINDLISELEYLVILKEKEVKNKVPKKKQRIILIPTAIILLLIVAIFPKIKLLGECETTISYTEQYTESGYKANAIFKNITKKVKVDSNVVNGKVGTYKVNYYLKYKYFTIKKTRKVNVVDDVDPLIEVADFINVCPNDDVPDLSFKAIDEYDGEITDKVIRNDYDDKIVLSVTDKAENLFKTEVRVIKEDTEAPVITLKGDNPMYLNIGVSYKEPGFTAIDNCDEDITDLVTVSGTVNTTAGTYKVTYTVIDSSGNKAEVTRTVYVRSAVLYNNGTAGAGTIYLTFDDGPAEGTTNAILDVLKEEGVKATFFVTCSGPDYLIKRIVNEGHTIALHTATHNYSYIYSSVDNYFEDLNRVSTRVKNLTGIDSKIIRFPGGSSNTVSRQYKSGIMTTLASMVLERGYRYYDWNVDSGDAGGAGSSQQVYNNVVNHLSPNRANMVLMHDIKYTTKGAIRDIIRFGKNNGYRFEKIDMNTYMIRHGINN